MNCLECRKPLEKGKYCSEKCGNSYRVRMHRAKNSSDLLGASGVEEGDTSPAEILSEIEAVVISCVQPNRRGAMPLELDPSLKNTINDPNPDWAPDKIITENNRTMTCPICGKLSLTHKRIEDGGTGPCFPYMGRRV